MGVGTRESQRGRAHDHELVPAQVVLARPKPWKAGQQEKKIYHNHYVFFLNRYI